MTEVATPKCPNPVRIYRVHDNRVAEHPTVVWCGCVEGCPEPTRTSEERRQLADNTLFQPPEYQDTLW